MSTYGYVAASAVEVLAMHCHDILYSRLDTHRGHTVGLLKVYHDTFHLLKLIK